MRYCLVLSLLLPATALSQEDKKLVMEPGPKTPQESLKCIKARPGFKVELMACEPTVMDPIAFAFGLDGKLWVVEMGDYPLGVKDKKTGKTLGGGRVKILTKSKKDGLYDKATVFLDGLEFPTGVFPWRDGVLITCAPNIILARDKDGDGKADEVVNILTGFREGNQQHRVNGLVWGLDNWIYGANGDSGGLIRSTSMKPVFDEEVNINGRDFRIKPDVQVIEAVSGQSQFGRCRDDWGNWFGNNNTNPMFHYVLEDRYLRRNPTLLFTDIKRNVSEQPGAAPVFPISKPLPRFNTPKAVNHFTSACSTIIYRDDFFGNDFEGNSFIAEPVHNLIHREIMRPDGLTFRSKRADDEKESEFLASSDNWFRPCMIQVGPDGVLWIADMYRYVIEHPEWIPKEWQEKLDLRAGHDMGRIYRVYPEKKAPREIPNLRKFGVKELVAALDSPSGWLRDTAHMVLVTEKSDVTNPMDLKEALKSKRPQTRLHALMVIQGLKDMAPLEHITEALKDPHPAIRKHAILCLEGHQRAAPGRVPVQEALKIVEKEKDPHVRLQLAYTLGEMGNADAIRILADLAEASAKDPQLRAAVLSSINETTYKAFIGGIDGGKQKLPDLLLRNLVRFAAIQKKPIHPMLFALSVGKDMSRENLVGLAMLCDALDAGKTSLQEAFAGDTLVGARRSVQDLIHHARKVVVDPKAPLADRVPAVRVLGRGPDKRAEDLKVLESLLSPALPDEIQQTALDHLAKVGDTSTPDMLLGKWKHFSPGVRKQAFDTLTGRGDWLISALVALRTRTILPAEIDAPRRERLLNHSSKDVRRQAAEIFGGAVDDDREKILSKYRLAITIAGDAKKGAKVFAKACASCHRLDEVGQNVGPELASVGDRTPEGMLNAILDPNRAIEARYLNYLATTKAGVTHTGILSAETGSAITLLAADGKKIDILRSDLEELVSTGKSAMPDGLEKDINLVDMADLLTYLSGALPKVEGKTP